MQQVASRVAAICPFFILLVSAATHGLTLLLFVSQ